MKTLRIDVWSDLACPWCYLGKRRLERALRDFPEADSLAVVWRAFELDPNAPRAVPREGAYADRLAKKYGSSVAEAEMTIHRMVETGLAEGIDFDFDAIRPVNTFDAHRLLQLARERGRAGVAVERFMRGYFSEGRAISDRGVLEELAAEADLDPTEVRGVLAGDAFSQKVRAEEEEAKRIGISGVPFFVFNGRYGVSGAQPPAQLLRVLDKAWGEAPAAAAS